MTKKPRTDRLQPGLFNARIEKPQASFERQTDNFAKGPWKPLLSQKPHAVVPLEKSLEALVDENQNPQYAHILHLPLTAFKARALGVQDALNEHKGGCFCSDF